MYYNYGWTPPDDNPEAKDPRLEKNRPALASIHRDKVFSRCDGWLLRRLAHLYCALARAYCDARTFVY